MNILTELAQIGNRRDPYGAISFPIYHSSTFAHPGFGKSTGFDYSRTGNPTRQALEDAMASLEEGTKGFAFSSGMGAITTILSLFSQGEHLLVTEDLYGGTYRILEEVFSRFGLQVTFVDSSDLGAIEKEIRPQTKAIFTETPTNPLMKVADLKGIASLCRKHGLLNIVDNTFLTPYLQKPLNLGADIVIHSGTKYLGGHNDVVAGLVVVQGEELAARFGRLQNSLGATLGPQDSWLVIRGLKTLALRMRAQEENALQIAQWLEKHPLVTAVYYPGLEHHPGYATQLEQARGFGAMLSFRVNSPSLVPAILKSLQIISYAESLGGVESLITYPATQTHADIPLEVRARLGVDDCLLRLSLGIEAAEDLIGDLELALKQML
ncbi:cystathionine gamma-synthase [Desulfitobacterium chlororespirans DSM 11544]|uniref:Cystathionine gamma-synthase n=2 Tax=Desulfitobacterium chlororespirans TaxID=51616 RepID=A0A1M7T4N9_9FIRM|nr:cystathionine gamma-synthase [Desulfitobacterium chlororespirans DSM 11544]